MEEALCWDVLSAVAVVQDHACVSLKTLGVVFESISREGGGICLYSIARRTASFVCIGFRIGFVRGWMIDAAKGIRRTGFGESFCMGKIF